MLYEIISITFKPSVYVYASYNLLIITFNLLTITFQLYKGKLENGSYVMIISIALRKKFSIQNLKARLDLLSKFPHPNLVSLLGHCIDG
jgi:hypothetical protein